jgi:hypothetical protein
MEAEYILSLSDSFEVWAASSLNQQFHELAQVSLQHLTNIFCTYLNPETSNISLCLVYSL